MKTYCINDFFYSLQGEGRWSGRPAVFIRFSGCNLRCPFCDTDYSMSFRIKLKKLVDNVSLYNTEMVVLTGGELPAAVIADAIVRLIPGSISDGQSALSDSFQDNLLAAPVYTRPADYKGWKVPDVLLCGDPKKVYEWQMEQSLKRTEELRPDLLNNKNI